MRNIYLLLLCPVFVISQPITAQITFSDQSSLLTNQTFESYQPTVVADMNGDGLDDIVRVNNSNLISIEYQAQGGGDFSNYSFQNPSSNKPWGMCVADVDENGKNDIIAGGYYDGLRIHKENGSGGYTPMVLPGSIFLQGINFADINNDGMLDIYACHDDATPLTYRATTPGNFVLDANLIPSAPYAGNYGSVWTDYDNDGDIDLYVSKCRQGVTNSADPRRINGFYKNNGDGSYTESALAAGIADGAQSWSSDFADIDNDGDMDLFVLNHDQSNRLFEQTGTPATALIVEGQPRKIVGQSSGNFSDIISGSGINTNGSSDWQSVFADFNNDGFVDLLIGGSQYALYLNNGNRTFTQVSNPFPAGTIRNFAVGDLNHDGFPDIYATYGSWANPNTQADKILMNSGNSNNFIAFDLQGVQSNINGVGARLELYGPWGVQVREVRSGSSYGIMNTMTQHFGIGTETQIDSVVIKWPSGVHQRLTDLAPNQFVPVSEAQTLLSVEMLDFTATLHQNNKKVDLDWSTATETNNDKFVIERSNDGNSYEEIGQVQGSGTSTSVNNYHFKDHQPELGNNYYRLKQVETGGAVTYSVVKVITIYLNDDEHLSATMLPTVIQSGDNLYMVVENPRSLELEITIWTYDGVLLLQHIEQPKSEIDYIDLSITGVPPGTYIVRVTDEVEHVIEDVVVDP